MYTLKEIVSHMWKQVGNKLHLSALNQKDKKIQESTSLFSPLLHTS